MHVENSVIAIFGRLDGAGDAVKKLIADGLHRETISVVGQGYRADEQIFGFYTGGDDIRFWGARGALWGELWAIFAGGTFLTVPSVGNVVALGYFATALASAISLGGVGGELSVLGAGFFSVGIPNDIIVKYESAIRSDSFVVMACGDVEQMTRARKILVGTAVSRVDLLFAHPSDNSARSLC